MNVILYALLWLSFGLSHSFFASIRVRARLEIFFGQYYRVAYNLFSLVHILLVFWVGHSLLSSSAFSFISQLKLSLFTYGIQILGALIILLALRQYDLGLFSGLSQVRTTTKPHQERVEKFNASGLNQWVRHPLYSGVFLFFWGGAISEYGLVTAILASAYLVVGTLHEEQKLCAMYGDEYHQYINSVPRFIPSFRRLFAS